MKEQTKLKLECNRNRTKPIHFTECFRQCAFVIFSLFFFLLEHVCMCVGTWRRLTPKQAVTVSKISMKSGRFMCNPAVWFKPIQARYLPANFHITTFCEFIDFLSPYFRSSLCPSFISASRMPRMLKYDYLVYEISINYVRRCNCLFISCYYLIPFLFVIWIYVLRIFILLCLCV